MHIEENKPLAPFTTFAIGGPARWFAQAGSEDDIVEATGWARQRGLKLLVLGGGSNLLVSDAGFDGLVLRIGLRGIETSEPGVLRSAGQILYRAAAGEDWDSLVQLAVEDGCAGIECLAGIPGMVGGTPVQNVGAYGQEVASTIDQVRVFDLSAGLFHNLPAESCGFGYRRSRFNATDRGRFIVTRVDFRLTRGGSPSLHYADLRRAFSELLHAGRQPSLSQVAATVRQIRQSKGMLIVPGDPDCRSAGSFFKNPVVTAEHADRIAAASPQPPPRFPAGPDLVDQAGSQPQPTVKLPAAWLIEQAGFRRGYSLGGAAISSRHTLALINRSHASSSDVLTLANQIRAAVAARFGIELETEPVMVGF